MEQEYFNEELPNSKKQGFSAIYRKKGLTQLIQTPQPEIKTCRDLLRLSKDRYGDRNCLGQIKISHEKDNNDKLIQKRTVIQHTYNQVFKLSYSLGKYLYNKNLYYQENQKNMKLVGMYSKNRYEWFITNWAMILFGLTNVPLYDTLGIDNLSFCLNLTDITTIFVSSTTIKTLLSLKDMGKIKIIISYDILSEQIITQIKNLKLQLLYFWDIIKQYQTDHYQNNQIQIGSNDCSTFSFTSGTTGPPKGAMISHQNMLSIVAAFHLHPNLDYNKQDRYLSYLPLPHLMERMVTLFLFYVGGNVIIWCGDNLKLRQDCEAAKITLFVSVPRVFSRIAQNIKNKFIQLGLPTFHHPAIFSKVRESFGGCIRSLGTGSAPISVEVLNYLKQVFQSPFLEGYGLTETTAAGGFSRSTDHNIGNISEISAGIQIKLCDIPEMKYTSLDTDENGYLAPRGQIWIRGPAVFLGYYKQPQLTKQALNEEGWFKSGDVVQINKNKGFKIIDRRKNIFKLAQGQYLAPDRIQNVYLKNSLISEVFLHGDGLQHYAVAIVTPNRQVLQKIAAKEGISGTYEQICANLQIKKIVLSQISKTGKQQGLNGYQIAKNIYLETKGFIFKGILTNTLKLIRFEARKAYKNQIEKLYSQGQILLK